MTYTVAPYCMTNDNAVMMIFVMNIIGIAYVFLMNGSGIFERLKCMFYYESKSAPFNNRTHITRICNVLLYIQTLFYSTIIASAFILESDRHNSGETILPFMGIAATLFVAVLLFKYSSYNAVNAILFDKQKRTAWNDFYFFTIKLLGFALTPAIIAILFIPAISFGFVKAYLAIILVAYLYTVISNIIKIIFARNINILDIFLYLCTIEFLPALCVWKFILQLNEFITIKI